MWSAYGMGVVGRRGWKSLRLNKGQRKSDLREKKITECALGILGGRWSSGWKVVLATRNT